MKVLEPAAPSRDGLCVLLAHGPDRSAIFRAIRKVRKQQPEAMLEILHGATKFGDGEALGKAIERLKSEGGWVSVSTY